MAKKSKSNKSKSKSFTRVCPNCFSSKLNSHLGLSGEGYKCLNCGFDNFTPIEFEKGKEPKIRTKFKKFKNPFGE